MTNLEINREEAVIFSGSAIDKINKFGWTTKDVRGKYNLIPKRLLNIANSEYQRDASQENVLKIASSWSWIACGALIVARRPDGSYWVIDGQHRLLAARRRSDITDLPCMVWECSDIVDEAQGFLNANTKRRALQTVQKYRANIIAEDETTLIIQDMLLRCGRVLGSFNSPTTVSCGGTLEKCLKSNKDAMLAVWPLITRLCEGNGIHNWIVLGFYHLETSRPGGISRDPKVIRRLEALDLDTVMKFIAEARAYHKEGGAKVYAKGIARAINWRSRNPAIPEMADA